MARRLVEQDGRTRRGDVPHKLNRPKPVSFKGNIAQDPEKRAQMGDFLGKIEFHAEQSLIAIRRRWRFFEALANGDAPVRYYIGDADVDCQLSLRIVQTAIAKVMEEVIGLDDRIARMIRKRPEDEGHDEWATAVIEQVIEEAGIREAAEQCAEDFADKGTCCAKVTYEVREETVHVRDVTHDEVTDEESDRDWERQVSEPREEVIESDRLVIQHFSPYDITIAPDAPGDPVQTSDYLTCRYWLDQDQLDARFDPSLSVTERWFNREEVLRAAPTREGTGLSRDWKAVGSGSGYTRSSSLGEYDREVIKQRDGVFAHPGESRGESIRYEVKEVWCRYHLQDNKGMEESVMHFVEDIPVSGVANQLWGQYRPFVWAVWERKQRQAHGRGAVEPIAAWHMYLNGLLQQAMDAALFELNPMWAVQEDANIDEQSFAAHPGAFVHLEKPKEDLVPIPMNFQMAGQGFQYYGILREEGFAIPGFTEAIRGDMGRKVSATQFSGTASAAESGMRRHLKRFQRDWVEGILNICHKQVQQFFTRKMLLRIAGTAGDRYEKVFPADVVSGFRVEAAGRMRLASRAQNSREAMNVVGQVAGMVAQGLIPPEEVDIPNTMRALLSETGLYGVEDTLMPKAGDGPMGPLREIELWRGGIVPDVHPQQDHQLHLEAERNFALSEDFEYLPMVIQEKAKKHMDDEERALEAQMQQMAHAMQQAQMQQLQRGGGLGEGGMTPEGNFGQQQPPNMQPGGPTGAQEVPDAQANSQQELAVTGDTGRYT